MMARIGFIAFTLFCGISVGKEFLSEQTDAPLLAIRYLEKGEKTKVLAEHTLQVSDDGTLDFSVGGEASRRPDEPAILVGTQITGKLTSTGDDSYRVTMSLRLGNEVGPIDDAVTQVVRSECLEVRTKLKLGRQATIGCGGNRSIELRVEH